MAEFTTSAPSVALDAAAFLVRAAELNDIPKVKALLETGVDVDAQNKFGDNALQCATRCGHVEMVDLLCSRGAKLDAAGMRAETPLEWAAFLGQVALERVHANELDARTASQFQPLHWAAALGHLQVALILVDHGAGVGNATPGTGRTPLHCAVENDQLDLIVMLLQAGAPVDARDSWDRTPLHYACARGLAFAAEILVKSNADVAAIGKVGVERWSRPLVNLPEYTPLHLTAVMDWAAIAKLLISHGADVTTRNRFHQSALGLATKHRAAHVMALLHTILPPKAPPPRATSEMVGGLVAGAGGKSVPQKGIPVSAAGSSLREKVESSAGKEKGERARSTRKRATRSARPKLVPGSSSPDEARIYPKSNAPAGTRANLNQLDAKAAEEERRLWSSASAAVVAFVDEVCQANVRALREHHHRSRMEAQPVPLRAPASSWHPEPGNPAPHVFGFDSGDKAGRGVAGDAATRSRAPSQHSEPYSSNQNRDRDWLRKPSQHSAVERDQGILDRNRADLHAAELPSAQTAWSRRSSRPATPVDSHSASGDSLNKQLSYTSLDNQTNNDTPVRDPLNPPVPKPKPKPTESTKREPSDAGTRKAAMVHVGSFKEWDRPGGALATSAPPDGARHAAHPAKQEDAGADGERRGAEASLHPRTSSRTSTASSLVDPDISPAFMFSSVQNMLQDVMGGPPPIPPSHLSSTSASPRGTSPRRNSSGGASPTPDATPTSESNNALQTPLRTPFEASDSAPAASVSPAPQSDPTNLLAELEEQTSLVDLEDAAVAVVAPPVDDESGKGSREGDGVVAVETDKTTKPSRSELDGLGAGSATDASLPMPISEQNDTARAAVEKAVDGGTAGVVGTQSESIGSAAPDNEVEQASQQPVSTQKAVPDQATGISSSGATWDCRLCSHENTPEDSNCKACRRPRFRA